MTNEIWAACIIAIIQIIAMVLVTKWQIISAKALMNPEQNDTIQKQSRLAKLCEVLSKTKLLMILPSAAYIVVAASILLRHGISHIGMSATALIALIALLNSSVVAIVGIMRRQNEVLSHILRRLVCHESILFELTDKPCKNDGVCRFNA